MVTCRIYIPIKYLILTESWCKNVVGRMKAFFFERWKSCAIFSNIASEISDFQHDFNKMWKIRSLPLHVPKNGVGYYALTVCTCTFWCHGWQSVIVYHAQTEHHTDFPTHCLQCLLLYTIIVAAHVSNNVSLFQVGKVSFLFLSPSTTLTLSLK